jgi:ATP-dependent Clp protease ATP-binding subunit ClpX
VRTTARARTRRDGKPAPAAGATGGPALQEAPKAHPLAPIRLIAPTQLASSSTPTSSARTTPRRSSRSRSTTTTSASTTGPQGDAAEAGDLADVELDKSNILLIGPTGTGKTLLAQSLARMLDVPFAIADATTLTEAGYVGEDVENVILRLLQAADMRRRARRSAASSSSTRSTRSAASPTPPRSRATCRARACSRPCSSCSRAPSATCRPPGGRKHPEQQCIRVDTADILFICGGAFVGLDRLIAKRAGSKALGFVPAPSEAAKLSAEEIVKGLQPEDLFAFGMIPEFVGRLPVISVLEPLDREALIRILTEPRNAATKQYRKLFALSGMTLEFTREALEAAADKALALGTGARGLRSVLENVLLDTMYALPTAATGSKFTVTPEAIRGEQPVTVAAPKKKAS